MLKSEGLQILSDEIAKCTKCEELAQYREDNDYKTVPGVGNPDAKIMVIGEAPGKDEAEQGEPFVGRAGQLLTNILEAAGMARKDIFIANILKCRPPGNRDPKEEEAVNCRQYLNMQIKIVDPEWILCFGRIASVFLLYQYDPKNGSVHPRTPAAITMGQLRGEHEYEGRKVICTYHPAYLLRNPAAKKEVWDDLQPIIGLLS